MINLYEKTTTNFNNNGIAILQDVTRCEVTEELNGEYSVELEYPKKSKYAAEIEEEKIIKCDSGENGKQLFRITNTEMSLTSILATLQHITYDLADNTLEDVYPQNLNGTASLNWILTHTQYSHNFTSYSNIAKQASARYVRKNPIEAIIGDIDNSFVNIWGGELVRDNFLIKMLKMRGSDKGYKIKYRKNLSGITFTKDITNIITRLRPVGYGGILLPEKYVNSPLINNYAHIKIGEIKYDDIKLKENADDEEGYSTLAECYTEMRRRATLEFSENNIDKPLMNVKVDFVDLSKTTAYADYQILTDVKLGDTVTIVVDNINVKVRVIRSVYDSLKHRYIELELGEFKGNYVTDTQKTIQKEVKKETENISSDVLSKAQEKASELILKATTGYIVLRPAENPTEILVMDAATTEAAKKVWRWNMGGFGYSSTGVNGTYGTAITMDGAIVADFITAGILSANLIKTGTMGLNRLYGNILTIGGNNNISGKIVVKDASANDNVIIDSAGLTLANGAKLIGGNGVLSNFQFGSYDWKWLGYSTDAQIMQNQYELINIPVYIPSNITITDARIMLFHSPIKWAYNTTNVWGYSRKVKAYKKDDTTLYYQDIQLNSEFFSPPEVFSVEIQKAFGENGFTAAVPSNNSHICEVATSSNIATYLTPGKNTMIQLRSGNTVPAYNPDIGEVIKEFQTNCLNQTGNIKAIINIIGFVK